MGRMPSLSTLIKKVEVPPALQVPFTDGDKVSTFPPGNDIQHSCSTLFSCAVLAMGPMLSVSKLQTRRCLFPFTAPFQKWTRWGLSHSNCGIQHSYSAGSTLSFFHEGGAKGKRHLLWSLDTDGIRPIAGGVLCDRATCLVSPWHGFTRGYDVGDRATFLVFPCRGSTRGLGMVAQLERGPLLAENCCPPGTLEDDRRHGRVLVFEQRRGR